MDSLEIARRIVRESGTRDPFEIAAAHGISVRFGRWHPVTYGEFDRARQRVTINLKAPVEASTILAHELGHHFLGADCTERACDEFADELLNI